MLLLGPRVVLWLLGRALFRLPPRVEGAVVAPRIHNVLSYSIAAVSLPLVVLLLAPGHLATLPVAFWTFHFVRRTAESLWVHRYSGRPVPWSDALIEYAYYWGFGAWIGWAWAGAEAGPGDALALVGAGVFLLGEVGNAWAHVALRRLRTRAGVADRTLPRGGPFELVDCPHYLFEILSWLGFALLAGLLASWIFLAAVTGTLTAYARTRHRRYQEEFDGREGRAAYPPGRRALIPGIF